MSSPATTPDQGSDYAPQDNIAEQGRREFLGYCTAAMGVAGAAAVAIPLVDTMNPAADTMAISTTEVDISALQEGQAMTVMWRGKPVFIRRRTAAQITEVRAVPLNELKNPQKDEDRVAQSVFNGKEMPEYLVTVGVCTHLGCIPLGQKGNDPHGEFGGWFCPCHGSQYDPSGRIRKGPAPRNLDVPIYTFINEKRIKIIDMPKA
jgi:ubiquinol-cytochrome c reductase iron-sulfur subunit